MNLETLHNEFLELLGGILDYNTLNLSLLTAHSTRIEGSALSTHEVINLIQNNQVSEKISFLHHLMVSDHQNALQKAMIWAKNKEFLSENKVKELSILVMQNTGLEFVETIFGTVYPLKGDFRKGSASAGTRQFIEHNKIAPLIEELLYNINSQLERVSTVQEVYDLAFFSHYQFINIHPFVDGNGRVARLIMNYIQAYHQFPLTAIDSANKIDYYNVLNQTKNEEDISIFLKFMYKEHIEFIQNQIKEIQSNIEITKNIKNNPFTKGNIKFNLLF